MFKKWFVYSVSAFVLGCEALSAPVAELPPLDIKRITADEARGIKFSDDKRTLLKFQIARRRSGDGDGQRPSRYGRRPSRSSRLRRMRMEYVIPSGVNNYTY